MTVELTIRIVSPLSADDQDLLSGVAVMTLAIANRALTGTEEQQEEPVEEPQPCGDIDGTFPQTRACVSPVGHRGRHKYRPFAADGDGPMSRVN